MSRLHRSRLAVLAAAIALGIVGCDWSLVDTEEPETARILVGGSSTSGNIRVITSTRFRLGTSSDGTSQRPSFIVADTILAPGPIDEGYDLRATGNFYVEVSSPDSTEADLSLRVLIDDAERYSEARRVTAETLTFLFVSRRFDG